MDVIVRMLARKALVLGVAVLALFMAVSLFAGQGRAEQLVASYYGKDDGFAGLTTANGETFDPYAYTAAHKTLPFDTKLAVTYEGETVVVRINDRGPYIEGRDLDLSYGSAEDIGLADVGVAPVNVEYVDASTPVGLYQGSSQEPDTEPDPEPSPEPVMDQEPSSSGPAESEPSTQQDAADAAAEDQYTDGDQNNDEPPEFVSANQYEDDLLEPVDAGDDQYEPSGTVEGDQSADGPPELVNADQTEDGPPEAVRNEQSASSDQYPVEEPGAGDDQYDDGVPEPSGEAATPPSDTAPRDIPEPQQPSPATLAPAAEDLEEPPAELVRPGTTVERRVEVETAAAPGTTAEGPVTPDPNSERLTEPDPEEADPGADLDQADEPQTAEPAGESSDETVDPDREAAPSDDASSEGTEEDVVDGEPDASQEYEIERLPDTGGWVKLPGVSAADMMAVLLVAVLLRAGLRGLRTR